MIRWSSQHSRRMRSSHRVAFGLLIVAACGLTIAPANAGEVISTRAGQRVHWARDEIVLNIVQLPARASISSELFAREIREAAAIWNRALSHTQAPRFRISDGQTVDDRVGHNGQSIIVFQTARRCSRDISDDMSCYSQERNAVTHVYPDEGGVLDEADVEINGFDVDWRAGGNGGEAPRLRAVLVHELGHALGLDHSCGSTSRAHSPCSSTEAKASLMYPDTLEAGRSLVLVPGPDERTTLATIYGERRGCSCAATGPTSGVGLEWLVLVVWLVRTRVAQQRCRALQS